MRPRLLSQLDGKSSHYPRTALHQHDAAFYRPGHVHGAMGRIRHARHERGIACKFGEPIGEALQAVYGLNPLSIGAPFQQWGKDNYSPLDAR